MTATVTRREATARTKIVTMKNLSSPMAITRMNPSSLRVMTSQGDGTTTTTNMIMTLIACPSMQIFLKWMKLVRWKDEIVLATSHQWMNQQIM